MESDTIILIEDNDLAPEEHSDIPSYGFIEVAGLVSSESREERDGVSSQTPPRQKPKSSARGKSPKAKAAAGVSRSHFQQGGGSGRDVSSVRMEKIAPKAKSPPVRNQLVSNRNEEVHQEITIDFDGGEEAVPPVQGDLGPTPAPGKTEVVLPSSRRDSPDVIIKQFTTIVTFVKELWSVYTTKSGPFPLYNRLIDHVKFTDTNAMKKFIEGFVAFFENNDVSVFSGDLKTIPPGTEIIYTPGKIYIPIQAFIHKGTPDIKETIRQHLMAIAAVINPGKLKELDEKAKALAKTNGVDLTTVEGRFIDSIMQKANTSMESVDANNPAAATFALLQSGILGDMIGGIQQGVESGEMDLPALMGMMQTSMSQMMAGGPPPTAAPGGSPPPAATRGLPPGGSPPPAASTSARETPSVRGGGRGKGNLVAKGRGAPKE